MLNIISAGIRPSACTCTSTGDHTSSYCDFSQCSSVNITKFYVFVTPTHPQNNTVLQLHLHLNGADTYEVINGSANHIYPFVYEFTPEQPLSHPALLTLTFNDQAVHFSASENGCSWIAVQGRNTKLRATKINH